MFTEFYDVVTEIYDVLLYNLICIFSMDLNPRNSCVKSLHSHAIGSLVSMTLDSILEEYCIRFVGGFSFDFYAVGEEILFHILPPCFILLLEPYILPFLCQSLASNANFP